ncbi:MAG: conjugal transfer protein TraE, partial [Bacteroides stercoris]
MTSDDIWRHLMTPLNNSVLSLFIFAVEFKFMSYPNDSTM